MSQGITQLFLGLLVGLSVFSMAYPWRFASGRSRILVHLPVLIVALAFLYNSLIPLEMNIRVDLVILLPFIAGACLCYVWKLFRLLRGKLA